MRPLLHFCHLQKSLQYADTLFIRRKSGDIFAVLKGAWGGGGVPGLLQRRRGGSGILYLYSNIPERRDLLPEIIDVLHDTLS